MTPVSRAARTLNRGDTIIRLNTERTADRVVIDRDVVLVFYTDGTSGTFAPSEQVWVAT